MLKPNKQAAKATSKSKMFGRPEQQGTADDAAAAADLSSADASKTMRDAAHRRELWRDNQQQSVEDMPAAAAAASLSISGGAHSLDHHTPHPPSGKTTFLYTPSRGGAGQPAGARAPSPLLFSGGSSQRYYQDSSGSGHVTATAVPAGSSGPPEQAVFKFDSFDKDRLILPGGSRLIGASSRHSLQEDTSSNAHHHTHYM